ncbi:MAG TPA: type II toxin-antitoxin system ParD family antitoxin [Gemmataceae bacterium]|nr:type II toxin-antitoxin system ParD family antitoxin [Gemmataceae bacterium]
MDISLTPDLLDFVNRKIARGDYPSASDVVRDGLLLLRERDASEQKKLEQLRQDIAIGIEQADQGMVYPFNEHTLQLIKQRTLAPRS